MQELESSQVSTWISSMNPKDHLKGALSPFLFLGAPMGHDEGTLIDPDPY